MICNVRQNTIDNLKKRGLVDDNMKIISTEFGLYNDKYSQLAKDKYGVTNADKLFTVDIQQIPILYPTGNRENFKQGNAYAVVNDEFFDELQELHNEYHKDSEASAYYQLLNDEMTPVIEQEDVESMDQPVAVKEVETVKPKESDNQAVIRFLEKIGVAIQSVNEIRDADGNLVNAAARASMLNKIIQVVENKASLDTLPEEAAHFFVEMLGPGHPLYKEMYNKITGYTLYTTTVNQYKGNKAFRNEDGSINFDKIKKEAMGKLIAEHILKNQALEENQERLGALVNWFNRLWEYISSIFNQADENPFEDAAQMIIDGDTAQLTDEGLVDEEYYQLADPLGGLKLDQDNIDLDNSIDTRTGQKRHIYKYKGENAKGSVTSVYVDRWLKKIFRSDQRSDKQKLIDLAKAEYGDIIHEQIQDIVKSWLNEDGTKRATQMPIDPVIKNAAVYKGLNEYMQEVLNQYDNSTVFMTEVKIFDQKTKIAGSIDLLAIQKDGLVDIYDWKSQEIGKEQTDIKTYKEQMYRIQLENYRKILQLQYGFQKFGRIRAIPIRTAFSFRDGKLENIKGIEVGNIDATKIPDEKSYLLPVPLRTESTGDEQLDSLVEQLNGIYDKIQNTRYTKEEVYKKREELSQLRIAIRDLQLKGKVNRIIDLGLLEYKKYSEMLENKTFTGRDTQEAIKILEVFGQSGVLSYDLRDQYYTVVKQKGDPKEIAAFEKINEKFIVMTSKVTKLIDTIKKYRDEQTSLLAESNGIFNYLNPEAPVGTLRGWLTSLSNIPQKAFRIFSKILRFAQNKRDAKFDKTAGELLALKKKFKDWASSKGISTDKAMEMILQLDAKGNWNGNFVSPYKSEFYTSRDKAIEDGNFEWFVDNVEFDDVKFAEAEKKQIEFFNSIQYALDEKENEALIAKKILEWKSNFQVIKEDGKINTKALINKKNRYLKPKAQWYTEKWTELNRKDAAGNYVNGPLKEMYDYFQSLSRYAEDLGMIDRNVTKFIPSLYADKLDQLVFGDVKGLFSAKGLFENLEVDSGTTYTPEVDPTDGSIINRIPVYFTKDMGATRDDGTVDYTKKSRDLFKVFGVWAAHMYNYEAMHSIEDQSLMLLEAERNKKSLVTDNFNNIVMENGKVKSIKNNDRNANLLENFVNYYLYDRLNGKGTDTKIKVPFINKEYSLLKTVQSAISFFSLKTLALNPISASAQFVGGTGNALFLAQKGVFFTNKTWAKAVHAVGGSKKARAALVYLNILQEGNKNTLIDDLSLSATNTVLKKDNFYAMQRIADKGVQYPVAIAIMMDHMVKDGQIVSIQKFVKDKYNYNDGFYSLSSSERKALMAKIDKEVGELQDTESILVKGELGKDGQFSIPGIDKESDTFSDFRSKIKGVSKKILGNSTRDDINNIRSTVYGSALMQFRNWIPEMVEERIGGLQYDDELQSWTYGKFNVFFSKIFLKNIPTLLKGIIAGFGDDVIKMAKEKFEDLKRDALEKGQDFTISEAEFIDMYKGNLRSMMLELMVLTSFAVAVMSIVSGDDEDRKNKGMRLYLARALKKYYNEFAFYYLPTEFTKLIKSPVPAIGLAEDMFRFIGALSKESYGQLTGDEDLIKSAKPLKYFNRMVPVAKEGMLLMATYDDDFRKDWDIKLQAGF